MTLLAELVDTGDATFSVFSPDATRSGLVRAIVAFVEESTGAVPVRSFQIRHTAGSIERFVLDCGCVGRRAWNHAGASSQ